jgi:hypothetical protein
MLCARAEAKHTRGFAPVTPLLPPRARERGAVELPHTHEQRLVFGRGGSRGSLRSALRSTGASTRRAGAATP